MNLNFYNWYLYLYFISFVTPPFRLRRNLGELRNLWRQRQRQLNQHMIFATIRVVRSWDVRQFQQLGVARREAILKALNEDADKLLSDYTGEGVEKLGLGYWGGFGDNGWV